MNESFSKIFFDTFSFIFTEALRPFRRKNALQVEHVITPKFRPEFRCEPQTRHGSDPLPRDQLIFKDFFKEREMNFWFTYIVSWYFLYLGVRQCSIEFYRFIIWMIDTETFHHRINFCSVRSGQNDRQIRSTGSSRMTIWIKVFFLLFFFSILFVCVCVCVRIESFSFSLCQWLKITEGRTFFFLHNDREYRRMTSEKKNISIINFFCFYKVNEIQWKRTRRRISFHLCFDTDWSRVEKKEKNRPTSTFSWVETKRNREQISILFLFGYIRMFKTKILSIVSSISSSMSYIRSRGTDALFILLSFLYIVRSSCLHGEATRRLTSMKDRGKTNKMAWCSSGKKRKKREHRNRYSRKNVLARRVCLRLWKRKELWWMCYQADDQCVIFKKEERWKKVILFFFWRCLMLLSFSLHQTTLNAHGTFSSSTRWMTTSSQATFSLEPTGNIGWSTRKQQSMLRKFDVKINNN